MGNSEKEMYPRFVKSPWAIYILNLVFFGLVWVWKLFPHDHPGIEGTILLGLFWLLNISTLLIGWVWWMDKQRLTGAAGIIMALALGVLLFS